MKADSIMAYGAIRPQEDEQAALNTLGSLLDQCPQLSTPRFLGPGGEEIALPESVFQVLRQLVQLLAHGQAVAIMPIDDEMTTQQAADLLNVSRPYLIKLLEQGDIPYSKTGTHRRIRLRDLLEYKERRDALRHQHLADLTQMSQEMGLYGE